MNDHQLKFWMDILPRLHRRARRYLLTHRLPVDLADDIMQEAWCRFEKTISAKLLEEVWEPVLCRTVLNLVLDLGRKRDNQTSMKVDIDELPRELNDGPKRRSGAPLVTPSHEAAVVNRVFAEQATARLGLSPPEREALRLQIMELQTQEEIAERLGVSARQVRRYILDGMTKVRAFLK